MRRFHRLKKPSGNGPGGVDRTGQPVQAGGGPGHRVKRQAGHAVLQ